MTQRRLLHYWPFSRGVCRLPLNFPQQGPVVWNCDFSLFLALTNCWVVDNLRHQAAHITVYITDAPRLGFRLSIIWSNHHSPRGGPGKVPGDLLEAQNTIIHNRSLAVTLHDRLLDLHSIYRYVYMEYWALQGNIGIVIIDGSMWLTAGLYAGKHRNALWLD